MTTPEVRLRRLAHGDGLPLPAYQSAHAAGLDLAAAVPQDAPVTLAPGERGLIATGFAIAPPDGFEAQVRPAPGSPRATASPCSTRPAPSMRTIAARCR